MVDEDLLDRLFRQAREVVLGNRDRIEVDFEDLVRLVGDEVLQVRFRARYRLEAQNEETRELILLLLEGIAAKAIDIADQLATDADGIDSYVGRPGIGMTAAAVALLVASAPAGPLIMLAAGLAGMAVGGFGSNMLRKRSARLRAFGTRVRALVADLKNG